MGVPKFYRWISERYPCLSEVIKQHQIPDFDNLYLDMNGIIHTCSHPNDDDPFFRITEEKVFAGICHYIDFLFKMIKPKKVFFMAVDGVAPRAKMNQQRGRRFRTAKTAKVQEEEAKRSGSLLPTEARFDSNCITPGTVFMVHLHEKLKSFVAYKISTDVLWRNIRVYLSGHETPGEGEHKIMDFIRYEKSQPGYNPNTRHCLYGLDADLIMLGLCSHEPYFSLLREEVKFGSRKTQKRIVSPEETTFHLLHISLLRDYLEHEFSPLKDKVSFKYNVENIVDDFVLMSFLVGNDFIPHLPQMHIHHDALPVLFKTYIDVLPTLGGYINLQGYLHLERFEIFLKKLAEYDFQKFGELSDDLKYLESKCSKHSFGNDYEENLSTTFRDTCISRGMGDAEFDSYESENSDQESALEMEFAMHKTDYYVTKLEFEKVTPEIMKDQAEGYVRAIQWNLHYYYNGVVSWSWYYPHHYSPYISDLKDFKNMKMHFELGEPFLPFQQLLAVLPKLSKDLLPRSYQKLMCDVDSPLSNYYPDDFLTDLNGKQQEWEAIVLIPFINEKLLLKCAGTADRNLNEAERKRNKHGPHHLYTFTENSSGSCPSFLPGYFPSLGAVYANLTKLDKDFFRLSATSLVKGLNKAIELDKFVLGFPTLKSIKHTAHLSNEKVKVFQFSSQKDNMMLTITESRESNLQKVAESILGKVIYVGWPHFHEALVVGLSDGETQYKYENNNNSLCIQDSKKCMGNSEQTIWAKQVQSFVGNFYERWGIFVGNVDIFVHAKCLSGVKYVFSDDGKISAEKQWERSISYYALQTTIMASNQFKNMDDKNIKKLLPAGVVVFLLGKPYYGNLGTIVKTNVENQKESVVVKVEISAEPALQSIMENQEKYISQEFMPGYIAAQQLGLDAYFLSRLTGTFLIQTNRKDSAKPTRVNIGLNLKFNQKNEEVCGFSKKTNNQWLYSKKVVKTMNDYLSEFADFFEKLEPFIQTDIIYLEDIYPDGEGDDIINDMTNWLKHQACTTAERQQCGMEKLDLGIVCAIEKFVDCAIKKENTYQNVITNLQELYSSFFCIGVSMPDPSTDFHLFDRVVNVCHSSSVPLGLKGTIIGIRKANKESDCMYEILFDKEFFGGLASSCSTSKCYYMPPHKLLNLSHGERIKKRHTTSSMDKPRLDRNTALSTVMKYLQPGPLHSPVQNQCKPSLNDNQPFYKVNSPESPPMNSQFHLPVSNVASNSKTFVTPKASQLSSGHSKRTPPGIHNVWDDLKKQNTEPSTSKSSEKQEYGVRISTEMLFQDVQNHSDSQRNPSCAKMLPQQAAVPHLMNICLKAYGKPPQYDFKNFGATNRYIATVTLPDGNCFSSHSYFLKEEAAESAAETAVAAFRSNFSYNQRFIMPSPGFGSISSPPRCPFYPPHQFSSVPQMHHFVQPPYASTSMIRHINPFESTPIPDSFVKENDRLFLENGNYSLQALHFNTPPRSGNLQNQSQKTNMIYLPGRYGDTATVRVSDKSSSTSNMFVPRQVMNSVKTPETSSNSLSHIEWPSLPQSSEQATSHSVLPVTTRDRNDNNSGGGNKQSSYSEKSKTDLSKEQPPVKSVPSSATVLSGKKSKRIAAKFQNP